MKSKIKKSKLTLMMLLIISILAFSSCSSIPQKEITNALLEITVPSPYNEAGEPLITYNANSDEVVMDKDYYFDLIEYVIETEELKKIFK